MPEPLDRKDARSALARRVRLIRRERFGENGGPLLAHALRLPFRTWMSHEEGRAIPDPLFLRFIEPTRAHPRWLLKGDGERDRVPDDLA